MWPLWGVVLCCVWLPWGALSDADVDWLIAPVGSFGVASVRRVGDTLQLDNGLLKRVLGPSLDGTSLLGN